MTKFLDGPAAGQHLSLKRAPDFLRVAESHPPDDGIVWDALDQPEDEPRKHEILHAYRLTGDVGWCHVRSAKPGGSGFFVIASYQHVPNVADADMRTNEAWWNWCRKTDSKG